ncbi:hypothetical protein [Streptomyces sp. NPDC020141]|uniref:hypothetical protein n=1 Tax=Streptomyces sp. NPDC020141 TaxID=3365065 RepID=UPI0037AEB497
MGLGDRHQKKDVEAALRRVKHDRNGHRWGYVVCCPCDNKYVRVYCTPRSTGDEAKKIDDFTKHHRGCA